MNADQSNIVVCWTTIGDQSAAGELAQNLLARRVAACVQIDSVMSHYVWDGQACEDEEFRLTIKTSAEAAERLMGVLQEIHPYDQPQIVMTPCSHVDAGYADWVRSSTQ